MSDTQAVAAFLQAQGYRLQGPDYPIHVEATEDGRVRVRAVHHGHHTGGLATAGLWDTLSQLGGFAQVVEDPDHDPGTEEAYLVTASVSTR